MSVRADGPQDPLPLVLPMLRFVTVLVAISGAVGIMLLEPVGGPFRAGGKLTLDWVGSASNDPSLFNLGIRSEHWNSETTLAKNVDTYSNQTIVDLPATLQPSGDYMMVFSFVDPEGNPDVYMDSTSFEIKAADQQTSPTVSIHKSTVPLNSVGSNTQSYSRSSPATSSASSHNATSNAGSIDAGSRSLPTPAQSSSSSSSATTQSPQTQSATQIPKKSMFRGSIAGIAVCTMTMLILGFLIGWFCARRSRRGRKPQVDLLPQVFSPGLREEEQGTRESRRRVEKSGAPDAQNRQDSHLAKLRAIPEQLLAATMGNAHMEQVLRQNEAPGAQIRALQRASQTTSNDPPPSYRD
ncbi:hypothetical protein B0H19DRAFT_1259150 [Mycena capillaripes]|nr:hypothetical protein B0H19DRAFT_1259150 [Mycena capillaripes]